MILLIFFSFDSDAVISCNMSSSYFKSVNNLEILVTTVDNLSSLFLVSPCYFILFYFILFYLVILFIASIASSLNFISSL